MDWVSILGAVTGVLALSALAFTIGRYAGKVDDLCKMRDRISDTCVKAETLWGMKEEFSATIVKVDMLWKIYIEDNLIRHSNPGGTAMLSDKLKAEIRALLDNDKSLSEVKEPTLLVINRIGLGKFSQLAQSNKSSLGQVLAQANDYIFECLRK